MIAVPTNIQFSKGVQLPKHTEIKPISLRKPHVTADSVHFGQQRMSPAQQQMMMMQQIGQLQKMGVMGDPLLINFNAPVTAQSVAPLNQMLQQNALKRVSNGGGTIKLLLNTPGGEIYSGLQTVQQIQHIKSSLGIEVDTIVMGGQAASMGSLFFMAGTGRRIMGPNSSILIHQPRAMGIAHPMTLTDLDTLRNDFQGLHHRLQRLIAEKSGMSLEKVKELTNSNVDIRIYPLHALKLGLATHVLLDNGKALTKAAVQGLSDDEIKARDFDGNYQGLPEEAFDPMNVDMKRLQQGPLAPAATTPPAQITPVSPTINEILDSLKNKEKPAEEATAPGGSDGSNLQVFPSTPIDTGRPTIVMMA